MTVKLFNSPLYYATEEGLVNYRGLPVRVAVVASPLVEDGSGHSIDHPDAEWKVACPTTVSAEIPISEEGAESIQVLPVGTKLNTGDAIIVQRCSLSPKGFTVLESWDRHAKGQIIGEPSFFYNYDTNVLHVSVECVIVSTSPEKWRGYGKYRSNGGFLKSGLKVTEGDKTIFDLTAPLKEDGKYLQSERVVGGEEYKTLMYILNLLAFKMPDKRIIWNGEAYENEEAIIELVQAQAKRVTVTRSHIEDSVFSMFVSLYGEDADFEFDNSTNTVVHKDVWCWTGISVEIVEVPLTSEFMGKTKLFAEHIHYLGTEFPELYKVLLKELSRNQEMVNRAIQMAEETAQDKYLVIGEETEITYGEKINLNVEEGYILDLALPEYDLTSLKRLARMIKKAGFKGITLEGYDSNDNCYQYCLDLEVFLSLTGSISHKAIRNLFLLFQILETPCGQRTGKDCSDIYRYLRLISGCMEAIVVDSNALLARGAKTGPIAYTCRAASTIDASVALNELHISQEMATIWKLEEGDFILPGRVPVPGVGVLRLRINDNVPLGTVVLSAATKHAIEEGDVDGDSIIFLAFSPEGDLRKPPSSVGAVTVSFN